MIKVNVHEAKTKLSALLTKVETEKVTIMLCRNGKPIADIVPHMEKKIKFPLKPHPKLSKIVKINYDPTEPLSNEEWPKEVR